MSQKFRYKVTIQGIVQGVGFRPFVYQQARSRLLTGYVTNTSYGVEVEIEGAIPALDDFLMAIRQEAPPLSRITSLEVQFLPGQGDSAFVIRPSRAQDTRSALISPDMAVCEDCLREMRDPRDRRYRYPFINCTHCGPRYTIITDIPYDREKTTMAAFTMCPACAAEYHDPGNRRFHAQPNACRTCGPQVTLHDGVGRPIASPDPIAEAVDRLRAGEILAVKGLGGFHLAVDATREDAVIRLRRRKHREEKPLALMSPDLDHVRSYARLEPGEAAVLASRERPIVLLKKKDPQPLAPSVSPRNQYFGVMLPYAPLHVLLLDEGFTALVMTSGNRSEEPICIDNEDAFQRLAGIADFFLAHNRDIHLRSDDSIVQPVSGVLRQLRRSRGYVPVPVFLAEPVAPILACGAELKNTVCLTRGDQAFISQHVGDLENLETLEFFKLTIEHLQRILQIEPEIIACDLHPDYLSTRYAREQTGVELIAVQHHFAHMVGGLAEHGLNERVIGLSLDGSGYGLDGAIWGGEILVGDAGSFERRGQLEYLPLPGGARAIREPWRMAVSYLYQAFGEGLWDLALPWLQRQERSKVELLIRMMAQGINSPLTSSCGRLFDGVAALIGLRETAAYEGQAAIELEMIQSRTAEVPYGFDLLFQQGRFQIPPRTIMAGVVDDLRRGVSPERISRRFHVTITEAFTRVCLHLRDETGLEKVVLSGGVFQNRTLLTEMESHLRQAGFRVFSKSLVPTNDGGISLGQAVAAHYMRKKKDTEIKLEGFAKSRRKPV